MNTICIAIAFLLTVSEVTKAQFSVLCAGVCLAGTSCDYNTGLCRPFRQATTQLPNTQLCAGTQCPVGTLCDYNTGRCQAFRQATAQPSASCYGVQCPTGTQCDYNTGRCQAFRQTTTAPSVQLCSGVRCSTGTICNTNTGLCQTIGQVCPANSHYETCGSACPLRCDQPATGTGACTLQCVVGCVCDQFFMQVSATNKTCVRRPDCPSLNPGTNIGCGAVVCRAGMKCENGQCVMRTDCPAVLPGVLPPGCTYDSYIDSNGCPMPRVVCPNQNQGQCGANSVYSTCASACPATCENQGMAYACNKMCVSGCVCNVGYIFTTSNQALGCVVAADCPSRGGGGLICGNNEEVKVCGACDQYCGRNPRMCTLKCPGGTPQCGCKYGYSRNASGQCVLNSQC